MSLIIGTIYPTGVVAFWFLGCVKKGLQGIFEPVMSNTEFHLP